MIIDEVLAVGDAQFQKKCLGKMEEVGKEGRTVLFVSHNMAAISTLCSTAIHLHTGLIVGNGGSSDIIAGYLQTFTAHTGFRSWENGTGDDTAKLYHVQLISPGGNISQEFSINEAVAIEMDIEILKKIVGAKISISVSSFDGIIVFTSDDTDSLDTGDKSPGLYRFRAYIPEDLLNTGNYSLSVAAHLPLVKIMFFEEHCLSFTMVNVGGSKFFVDDKRRGLIRPKLLWEWSGKQEN